MVFGWGSRMAGILVVHESPEPHQRGAESGIFRAGQHGRALACELRCRSPEGAVTEQQIDLVQGSWRAVLAVSDTFAEIFYGKLFSLDPSLRPLFARTSMKEQGRSLAAMLSVATRGLSHPDRIALAVHQLGRRHAGYGVQPAHYEIFREALIWALQKCFGEAFTPETRAAWLAAYAFFAAKMQEATATAPRVPLPGRAAPAP
jgi:hemoglobin-like flavoprotein